MWQPDKEIVVLTSETEKQRYLAGSGPIEQWPHRVGRHEHAGEFPVMAVRQLLIEQGYEVYVSGLSKVGIPSYSLAMFPGQRDDEAFANTRRVLDLDDGRLDKFLAIANKRRAEAQLGTHGGDPDLLVQNRRDAADRFFVEVKAESRVYKDDMTPQQTVVFPLIQCVLEARIVLATVHILGVARGRASNVWSKRQPEGA
jgi:hypothetical protein